MSLLRDAGERALDGPMDPGAVAALVRAFREHGFTQAGVRRALDTDMFVRDPYELPVYRRKLAGESRRFATLAHLFLLGMWEPEADVAAALAPLEPDRLVEMGLLERDGDLISATLSITPTVEMLSASDWEREDRPPSRPDHVVGISAGSRALARLTLRRPVRRALDLGVGNGVQALLMARHAEQVVGTDVNPRALRVARLNAMLNGVDNLELREGDLYEPVAGERFDLVVSNVPYVISPETDYTFRDSGLPGDSFCEAALRGAPAVLEEGGICQMLVSVVHGEGEDPLDRLAGWVDGAGCDLLFLQFLDSDPLTYAAGWNRLRGPDPAAFEEGLERWMAHYEELGIERISWGAVLLRRRSGGRNWRARHVPPAEHFGPAQHQIERLVAAQDLLHSPGAPESLADLVLAPAEDVRLEQAARPRGGDLLVESIILATDGGLGTRVALDPAVTELVAHLDGSRTLAQALSDTAAVVAPGDERRFADGALPVVLRMVELGLIAPVP